MKMTSEQMEELLAPTYRVGIYCRLSKEDEDLRAGESQSIAYQHWALDGHGVGFIKRRLEENKVPCPTWWNRQRGIRNHYTKWELQDPENGRYVWDETVLTDMLINPVYYGAVASQKKNYKFKVGVINEKKPDEWIIVENMHEPIVNQDSFDIVQNKIESRKCTRGDGTVCLNRIPMWRNIRWY